MHPRVEPDRRTASEQGLPQRQRGDRVGEREAVEQLSREEGGDLGEESSIKSHMAIQARGAYELHSQRALSLEELLQFRAEAVAASG